MYWAVLAVVLWLMPVSAEATTYYVTTSGSDATGTGTVGNPWRNPQKCIGTVGPDDTCLVGDGTYTDTDGNGIVLYITTSTSARDGTSGHPVTIKAQNYLGAVLQMPSAATTNSYGVRVTRPYYVIEGFDITDSGTPTTQGASSGSTGVSFGESASATGTVVRRNRIRNISRSVCSDSPIGNSGIGGKPGVGTIIEYNEISKLGRKRNGEAGCTTTLFQNDHGIYVWSVSNFTVHHNLFYDNGRGYHIQIYASNQVSTGAYIYNNTFAQPTLTGSAPTACMIFTYTNTDFQVKNNIFYNCPSGYALTWFAPATQTNVVLSYNLTDSADADLQNPGSKPASGVSNSNNTVGSSSINFTNAGTDTYTLAASSAALDTGTNLGYSYNGPSPTRGAFDPPRFLACEVPSALGTKIRISFTNNLFPPVLPASAATTFTARKNAAGNALVGSSGKAGDNVIEVTVTSAYIAGNTADISWSSGNVTDSALIGGSWKQPYITVLSNQSCTNNVGGSSYVYTLDRYVLLDAYGAEGSAAVLPYGKTIAAAENYTGYSTRPSGKFRLRVAITCTVADCGSEAFYLYYAINGGAYAQIPSAFSTDNIAMCGSISGNPSNGSAVTGRLSTAGGLIGGAYVSEAASIPAISGFTAGSKAELEYCVAFDDDAAGYYQFRPYKQSGSALDAYTVTPRIDIGAAAAGGGN